MIVQESDVLLAALDHRLQVDRIVATASSSPVGGSFADGGVDVEPGVAGRAAAAARPVPTGVAQSSIAARLPLGRIVDARVVALTDGDHVVADIDRWRVALAWPSGAGALPRPGDDVALRVLAHQPMLLFQTLDEGPRLVAPGGDGVAVRWSREALELARRMAPGNEASAMADIDGGVRRFTRPIITIERRTPSDETDGLSTDVIGIDRVIVGHGVQDAPAVSAASTPAAREPVVMGLPLILQGPAWVGQPVELVVRHERADDELDNPVLDQWCGDVEIDLPTLGRVAGHLSLSIQGLKVRLEAADDLAVTAMTAASPELAGALADADFRVHALSVGGQGVRPPGPRDD